MPKIYHNGQQIDKENAKIAVDDRGFRYGDGVFETIRVEAGRALAWPLHMERLQAGVDAISIGFNAESLREAAKQLWAENGLASGFLRIAVSRGVGSAGYAPLGDIKPTVVMECLPATPVKREPFTLGLSAYEKISPRALPTHVKMAQGLQSTLCALEAKKQGVDDVILCDAKGNVAETSCANIFWIKNGKIYTPALSTGALAGVMRACVLATQPVVEGEFTLTEMQSAEAIFITNVRVGVKAVNAEHTMITAINFAVQQHINSLTW